VAFAAVVADVAHADPSAVEASTLLDDLCFDSFRMFELIVAIADQGVPFPEDVALDVRSVGDVYELVLQAFRGAGAAREEAS